MGQGGTGGHVFKQEWMQVSMAGRNRRAAVNLWTHTCLLFGQWGDMRGQGSVYIKSDTQIFIRRPAA